MKTVDLRTLSDGTLRARAEELEKEIAALRFQGSKKEKNVKKRSALRHDRARVLTLLRSRAGAVAKTP